MSNLVEIERVPLPARKSKSAWLRETVKAMAVGESFFVPAERFKSENYARVRASVLSVELGIKLSVRKDRKAEVDGLRFYRTA